MARGALVTVAGAGVLGLAVALALADAGCRVTVCDPAAAGENASGVAAGMLAPVFEAALDPAAATHFDLLLAARDLWPGLEARAGLRLDRSGALAVGDAAWLEGLAADMSRLGARGTWLGGATARGLAPGLSETFDAALLTREDWRLDAAAAMAALRRAAEAAGVVFRPEAIQGGEGADVLVVATGAAYSALAPELAVLSPIKGHIVRLETRDLGGAVVRARGGYVAPAGRGLLAGATMEMGVDDPRVDPARAAPLLDLAHQLFPGLGEAQVHLAAGIRAATPDGLPLVGPSREPGVILAVGARRNGWLLAPLVARIVAARVTGRDEGPFAARLDPGRFQ
jgi:glycine oxidase